MKCLLILAAGQNRRMRISYPKSLMPIGPSGRSCLDRLLDFCSKKSVTPYVVVGYQKDDIIRRYRNVNLIENDEFETTNVAYSLLLGLNTIKSDNVTVVNADVIAKPQGFMKIFSESSVLASTAMKREEVGLTETAGLLNHLHYGLPRKFGQIVNFSGFELDCLRQCDRMDCARLFLFEIINKIVDQGGRFRVIDGVSIDLDSRKDIKNLPHWVK